MFGGQRLAAVAVAAALAFQPVLASAQQSCVTQAEIGAIAIYSTPGVLQAVRLKCGSELSQEGYLARSGDSLGRRYSALQTRVWPKAKSGIIKWLGGRQGATQSRQNLGTLAALPDSAVRPLVDALIVQEVAAKIEARNCSRIEWVIEAMAPIDPEIAGSVLGAVVGLVDPDQLPVCSRLS
ncbi:hypothetical protein KK137_05420 [Croceibacterium sp. LX-88]|uniref:Uncharacterized protein n=1 Tax=Croceibacterium selenioxidans TaxID=2838833 RepID=A0ABS5W3B7_9SPHN|nr:hypothetical protein [Croceibacterium selenioxidans]MBT2133768.1 hypothetical protein [Croceibacterium selenioxidans]